MWISLRRAFLVEGTVSPKVLRRECMFKDPQEARVAGTEKGRE